MQIYFVYATCTSKESSLNAGFDAVIGNRLHTFTRTRLPHSSRPKMTPFFSRVVNVICIFYVIKSVDSWTFFKIAFVVR